MNTDYFNQRASVRNFSNQPVGMTQLNDILSKAMRAPTCGNMQLYSVIVTTDEQMRKELAALHFNQPAAQAPVLLTICADFNRFSRWCRLRDVEPGYNNFHSFIMALTDAVIFAQQIVTIAEMEGLGTCYLGTVNYNAGEISRLLELPELVVPVAAIALGYPAGEVERCERLPSECIIHSEKYRKDTDEDVLFQFREKENYGANQQYVKENGVNSLASLFADIRYPKTMNEKVSEEFYELLERKGFC